MILYRWLSRLPLPLLYALAWLGYILLYFVAGYRKVGGDGEPEARISRQKREGDHSSGKEILSPARARWALEIVKARRMTQAEFRQRVKVLNPELVRERSQRRTAQLCDHPDHTPGQLGVDAARRQCSSGRAPGPCLQTPAQQRHKPADAGGAQPFRLPPTALGQGRPRYRAPAAGVPAAGDGGRPVTDTSGAQLLDATS